MMVDVPFRVGDPSGSHSETWCLKITPKGPEDLRQPIKVASKNYGEMAEQTIKLRKNNKYEIVLEHLRTNPEYLKSHNEKSDYDWEAQIDSNPKTKVLGKSKTQKDEDRFFAVKNHWIVDNEHGLLGKVDDGFDDEDNTPGKKATLLPVEVVEVSPKTKDENDVEIAGSEKPSSGMPLTPFVELNPVADRIAHRELKVKIGEVLKGKTVTWTLEPVPGATPATIRGAWTNSTTHPNRFEASAAYGANGFTLQSQTSGKTTVANDGFTAVRVNVPPIGFNQVRIKIQVEGTTAPIDLIDMEVPGVVVIDPGHGGTTNVLGSSANNAVSPSGVLEKTMTLDYGLALRDSLRAKRQQDKLNLRVFMTRKTDDENPTGADRGHKARDNGADVLFVLHFNSDDDSGTTAHPRVPHRSRGTLEVYRTDSNVSPQEDTDLSSNLIDRMVAAMTPFDSGANHRVRVAYNGDGVGGPAVSSDVYNGNTTTYHPIRTAYIEGEFIDFGANTAANHTDDAVDILLNTGPNAPTVKTAITDAIRDGILQNIRDQP